MKQPVNTAACGQGSSARPFGPGPASGLAATILGVSLCWLGCDNKPEGNPSAPAQMTNPGTQATNAAAASAALTPEGLHALLKKVNPQYNGQAKFESADEFIVVDLSGTEVTDLSPLRGLPIAALDLRNLAVTDVRPLSALPLRELYLEQTRVEDLTPLRGLQLGKLYLSQSPVKNLAPLQGMPLVELNLLGCGITDLEPLRGMPLQSLWLNETSVKDLAPLAQCPLVSLTLHRTLVKDLAPLAQCPLTRLHIAETPVADLAPLKGLALTRLIFTPSRITNGLEVARKMGSLQEIGVTLDERMAPEAFWALWDQGKFK